MIDPAFDDRFWAHYPSILRPFDRSRHRKHGFSGSMVWRIQTEAGAVAVRRLSRRSAESPLDHNHLFRARLHGWSEVPQPLPNNAGKTFTKHDSAWWDVCTWQPGEPVMLPIDDAHLRSAMYFIARWHSFRTAEKTIDPHGGRDFDAVENRRSEWRRLWRYPWADLIHFTNADDLLGLQSRTGQAVQARARRIEAQLLELQRLLAADQLVYSHGDFHREHLLFTDGAVTGFIDLNCRWDFAAADLARWLSTTTEPNRWPQALEWYREKASLSAASERAIPMLASTGLAIAALRWERWLLGSGEERRFFPHPEAAYERWREVVERLEQSEL